MNSDWKCEQGSKMFKPLWRHRGQPLYKALVKKGFRWWTWLEINGIIWISLFILACWCNWIQPPERFLQPHWLVWSERMRIRMDREKLAVSQILSGDKIPLRRVKKVPTASWWPCWHREWQNIFLQFYDRQFLKVHIWFGCKTFQDCNKTVALILVSARVSWIPWNRGRSIWVGDIMASLSLDMERKRSWPVASLVFVPPHHHCALRWQSILVMAYEEDRTRNKSDFNCVFLCFIIPAKNNIMMFVFDNV